MTCFWDAILRNLRSNSDVYKILNNANSPKELVTVLKAKNTLTTCIIWQEEQFTKLQLKENHEWIKDYDISMIHKGHMTSSCDPFFCLLVYLLNIKIIHNYSGHEIIYSSKSPKKTFKFSSSKSHMR